MVPVLEGLQTCQSIPLTSGSAEGKFLTTKGASRAGLQEDSQDGPGRRPPGQPWQQSGEAPDEGVGMVAEASVPALSCTDGTQAEEGGGTCQSLHSKAVTELDVISPTVSHRPPCSTTGPREGGRRSLHLQQVLTEHVTALSAEMRGEGGCVSGMWGRFYILACTSLSVWLGQTVEQGLSKAPPPPMT